MPTSTTPIDPETLTDAVRRRFDAKVAEPDENGCRLWCASLSRKGYGHFGLRGRGMVGAHRVAYVLAYREDIPQGMALDHLCRVRHCVNPEHLRVVTNGQNLRAPGSEHWARERSEKTHCSRGHPLSGENVNAYQLRRGRGRRQCEACMRAHNRLSSRRRQYGTSWTEDELRLLADEIYEQRAVRRDQPDQGLPLSWP